MTRSPFSPSHLVFAALLATAFAYTPGCASSADDSNEMTGDAADDLHHRHRDAGADTGTSSGSSSGGSSSGSSSSSSGGSSSGSGSSSGGSSSGSGSSSGGVDSGSGGSSSGGGTPTGLFKAAEPWNQRVDADPKSPESDAIITWLTNAGGWGTSSFQIDPSIEVMHADSSTPFKQFTPTGDFYSPDCDQVPFPVPANGVLEGETGYQCTSDGDCHLLVVHDATNKLYEMWRANIDSSGFSGGCVAVWDLTKAYPSSLRGDGCTSADAGGFPITAMLATADEVAAGQVAHALRFILPNSRIRHLTFVHPGTHTTGPTSGGSSAPPYGVRFRLRADYPLASLPSDGARVLATALQRYGMFLADGGNVPLTVQGDRFTKHKWSDVGVDAKALAALKASDFEVVEMGTPITSNPDCTRN